MVNSFFADFAEDEIRFLLLSKDYCLSTARENENGVTPSKEDRVVTSQIAAAGKLIGIELVDHIIITALGFESIPLDGNSN